MFHPVGNQSPTVYWRRRLVLLASIAVLLVLAVVTVRALTSGGGDNAVAASQTSSPTTPKPGTSTSRSVSTKLSSTKPSSTSKKSPSPSRSSTSSSPPVPACMPAKLAVSAALAKSSYRVGDRPVVELRVINTGTVPCVQDLADAQIELRVYNGESRVWGSHDCKVLPGTHPSTLPVGSPVTVQVGWSGYTSQPKCVGTRQRVGAGTYTLYAFLAGRSGKAAQFSIS